MTSEPEQRRLGIGGHQKPVGDKDEWLTPPWVLTQLGAFDLDPCAPIIRPWPIAANHYTIEDNGLRKPWSGRVWLNPPYGGPQIVGPWMRRMAEHRNGIALTFARTETEVFFDTVWRAADAVLFIEGRLFFHHLDGTRARHNSGAPSVLIAYGQDNVGTLQNSGIPGKFIRLEGVALQ